MAEWSVSGNGADCSGKSGPDCLLESTEASEKERKGRAVYRILIVDDEMIFRKGIGAMLRKSDFGIRQISEAIDGCEALELLKRDNYDIVITDIRMPRMDGLMLCRSIRDQGLRPSIVILSGYDDFKYAQTAIQYGVSDYVLKPVSQRKLTEVLREVMRRREEGGNGLKYSQMDDLVTGLVKALWDLDREAWRRAGEEAKKSIVGMGPVAQEETLREMIRSTAGKISEKMGEELPTEEFGEHTFEENLELLWEMAGNRKSHGLLETVQKHLSAAPAMSQEELCGMLGFSSSHFSQIFKERTGKKFVDFRTQIRMEAARQKLCIPSKTVAQVAAEVGYSDYSHFSSVFKKFYGKSPAQFREERGLGL